MSRRLQATLTWLLLAALAAQVLRLAWLSDDVYITLRSVENFTHGYGAVYNVGERVQSFTHPLWMLLLSGVYFPLRFLGASLPDVAVALSLLVSLAAVAVFVFRAAQSRGGALGGLALLLVSKAFLDYATSGLEDALSFLLVAAFFATLPGRGEGPDLRLLAGVAALACLNRLDTALIYAPVMVWLLLRTEGRASPAPTENGGDSPEGRASPVPTENGGTRSEGRASPAPTGNRGLVDVGLRRLLPVVAGFTPLLAWELFSLFYYGFPFPNTAYAKLSTGIPRGLLLAQGGRYFADSLLRDPTTLLVIACAGLALLLCRRVPRRGMLMSLYAGVLLYLVYILWIGGDFMSGRFLAVPFFACVLLLGQIPLGWQWRSGLAALALLLVFGMGASPWRTLPPEQARVMPESGIVDERAWYFSEMRWLGGPGLPRAPEGGWVYDPARASLIELDTIGVEGYRVGPSAHIVDAWALADPLLARLPVEDPLHWRIGHFRRRLPEGYLETLRSGKNVILNPDLARFYERLRQVTRGPLWSPGRLAQVARINLGR